MNSCMILPLPPLSKLDEKQSQYYTMMDNIGMLFCVPVNAPDPAFTGYMLDTLP